MNSALFWKIWGSMAVLALAAWTVIGFKKRDKSNGLSLAQKLAAPLSKEDEAIVNDDLTGTIVGRPGYYRKKQRKQSSYTPPVPRKPPVKPERHFNEWLEHFLSGTAIIGDFFMVLLGFLLADQLCRGDLMPAWAEKENLSMFASANNFNLIFTGSLIVLWGLTGRRLYAYKSLLTPSTIWHKLLEGLGLCLLGFIAISQMLRSDQPIPWAFFVCAIFLVLLNVAAWRVLLSQIIIHSGISARLRRRLVVIGGGSQAMRIRVALAKSTDTQFVGWVQAIKPNHIKELDEFRLGSLHELEKILQQNDVNVAVLTETESLQREGVLAVAKACENEHVQFKMSPHFFEILISGLSPEVIGEVPLLGVECLPLNGFRNLALKRTIDIIGAIVGCIFSIPLIIIFGALVYWESPGPILYRQVRQGRNGRLFYIVKIRSMHVNAEADGKAQWAKQVDHRRLWIGSFLRKYNIDEVPQFWNVLIGQMSLVGPRPERPELIARFKSKIPHYQSRHKCRPGITGWAQVNGWRGNTDLEERIRHDIWYLENWSLWLDFRILLQTFLRQKNAY